MSLPQPKNLHELRLKIIKVLDKLRVNAELLKRMCEDAVVRCEKVPQRRGSPDHTSLTLILQQAHAREAREKLTAADCCFFHGL